MILRYRILFFIMLSYLIVNKAIGQVLINEIMSANSTYYLDPYTNKYSDWVEIYNSDTVNAVNLKGYFLTDNINNPVKYKILDECVIYPGYYALFWADGGNWWAHLNFKFSYDGEQIALFSPDTVLVDMVTFGTIPLNVSYGRKHGGSNEWVYFTEPTPLQTNANHYYASTITSESPVFSLQGGKYSGVLNVAINASLGSEIRYTTDGSEPNIRSQKYILPLIFDTTTIIRARTFCPGKMPSNIVSHTYFIDPPNKLPIVSVITSPKLLWDSLIGIYQNSLKDIEIPFNFEFIDTLGEEKVNQLVGMEIDGQVSYNLPQKMFNLSAKKMYGNNEINYKFFNNRNNQIFNSIILRNAGFPENSSTMFREAMMQQIVIGELDLDFQDYRPVSLYLNGKYWGIYNLREKYNDSYFAANNNADPNKIDFIENYWVDVLSGENNNLIVLNSFLKNCNINTQQSLEEIKKRIDYDNYLNYQITQIYYANTDWPGNNYRHWRQRIYNGKWRWVLYDVEFGFGLEAGYDNNTLEFVTSPVQQTWANPPEATWMFRRMLENDDFKNSFIQRTAVLFKTCFNPERIIRIIDSLQSNISGEMPFHIERWKDYCWTNEWGHSYCGVNSMPYWNNEVEKMREFARKRPEFMMKHIMQKFAITDTVNLTIKATHGKISVENINIKQDSTTINFFTGIPIKFEATPNPGYVFAGWSGISTSTNESISVTLAKDTFLIANFIPIGYTLIPSHIDTIYELTQQNSPYYALNDIVIDSFAVLKVQKGVEIYMPATANFIVYGKLDINGSENEPVFIRSSENNNVNWGGICMFNSTDTTLLNNVILENCSHGRDIINYKAAVSAFNADFIMYNVTISDAVQPVFARECKYIFVKKCKLRSNFMCDIINIKKTNKCIIEDCDISGNELYDTDGIDLDEIQNGIIRNNEIYGFLGINNDGIDIGEGAKNIQIENNKIFNCFDKGVSVGQGSTVSLKNNIINNCNVGIGVKDSNSFAFVDKNTFYNCGTSVSCYEKNIGSGGGKVLVVNTIFSKSKLQDYYSDSLSFINVTYSLSDKEIINGIGNIFEDPLFKNPICSDFTLQINSPCINNGDPSSLPDNDGSRADIGAYMLSNNDSIYIPKIIINEINYNSPLTADAGDWIELYNAENTNIDLSGWTFKDESELHTYYIPNGCTIPANGYVVLCEDEFKFMEIHPTVSNFLYRFDFSLSNGGELLRLYNNKMQLKDTVRYSDNFPWVISPDGYGPTLSLISPSLDNSLYYNWDESAYLYGTPGENNNHTQIPENEIIPNDTITLFPNPVNTYFYLKGVTDECNAVFTIFDLYGKSIYNNNKVIKGEWKEYFNVSEFKQGVYIVVIKTEKSTTKKKFVVIR